MSSSADKRYWNNKSRKIKSHHLEKNIARHKRKENINLIKGWTSLKEKSVLKTDLFEEMLITDSFYDWLEKEARSVVGIDISSEIVRKAQNNFPTANFRTEDVRKTSFKNDSFDLVISNSTLDHLPRKDMDGSLKELKRITKKDGEIILTLDNKENKNYYLFYFINKYLNWAHFKQENCYSLKEITSMCEQIGLEVIDYKGIIHIPSPFNKLMKVSKRLFGNKLDSYIRRSINKFHKKRKDLSTAWQIAVRLRKATS